MRRPPFTTWAQLKQAPVQPWDLCPEPWRWTELDAWASEVETWEFLKALVVLLKPKVIVETGTYLGHSAGMMALGCRENGLGHVWTFDIQQECCEQAAKFLEVEELDSFVTVRHDDARSTPWDHPIDLLFIDGGDDRLSELEHFVPFLTPRAVVVAHNAHDPQDVYHWGKLGAAWDKVMIPCPCGVWVMTRR